jgi:hypothetical protein
VSDAGDVGDVGDVSRHLSVSPAGRLRDAAAVAMLVAGVALYAWGNTNLRAMAAGRIEREPGRTAVERAEHYERISRGGAGVALLGVGVGVWSYLRHVRTRAARAP